MHPWSVLAEQMLLTGEPLKSLNQIDDFTIIRCVNRFVSVNLSSGNISRARLLAYAISKCHKVSGKNKGTGNNPSILKSLVQAIDSSIYNGGHFMTTSAIDNFAVELKVASQNYPETSVSGRYSYRHQNGKDDNKGNQICFAFNRQTGCRDGTDCEYRHICRYCKGSHAGFKCRQQQPAGQRTD